MSDPLKEELVTAATRIRPPRQPDWDLVLKKGNRQRLFRGVLLVFAALILGLGGWGAGLYLSKSPSSDIRVAQGVAPASHPLVFTATGSSGNVDIFIARRDGSEPINLTGDFVWNIQPVWSPDGRAIAYTQEESPGGLGTLYVMSSDGSSSRTLIDGPGSEIQPAWSPDGNTIAYVKNTDGSPNINVVNLDGSGDRSLVDRDGVAEHPSWSPDGTKVAFAADVGTNRDIFTVDVEGGSVERLTTNETSDLAPAWSPDGRKIAFLREAGRGGSDLYVMNPDGSGSQRVWPPSDSDRGSFVGDVAWIDQDRLMFDFSDGVGSEDPITILQLGQDRPERLHMTKGGAFDVSLRP